MFRALKSSLILTAALGVVAWAQTDYHVTQDSNRQIYIDSAFAHGHRHGYEEGFHAGDEDYHFRRSGVLPQKFAHVKGYRSSFGDKYRYAAGYENGFRAGYADSFAGRTFRPAANLLIEKLDLTMSQSPNAKASAADFDKGVEDGYLAGYSNGDHIAEEPGLARVASRGCRQESRSDAYCNGFGTGFVIGRADSQSLALIQKNHSSTLAKNAR